MKISLTVHRADNPCACLHIGNPDGYFQIYWTWDFRAYCLSFKHGFQTGWAP